MSTMTQHLTVPAGGRSAASIAPAKRRKLGPAGISALVVLIVLAAAWLLPFFWAIVTSLKSETDAASATLWPAHGFTFDAYAKVLAEGNVPIWAWNSLFTSALITAITVLTSALAAYAFSRMRFRGQKWAYIVAIAAIAVPPQVLIVPLFYEMLAMNFVDTYWGLILPQAVQPIIVLILKQFFDQIPIELEEAARVDGASRLRVFTSIVMPLSRPILAAASIFVFVWAWNNFLWPFIIINDPQLMTLPVGLQTVKSAYGIQYAQNMAMAILAALPLIIVFLFFQRQIIKGIATTGFGGQ
ncbi:carbohydrate ABC transporter permease [Paramicrobacterium agarici]|uniref:Carbohydrate ABC transporter membrane protein 2 (CUT1 family) n=1 Tax=Paramicrobacterium agarici TaxID=630514 RepID=A0A2A9DSB2_9MICO|nr:carbohydrate ABC transporter membrane protein 2 (CUT1 family) [Microbacterium agarici]